MVELELDTRPKAVDPSQQLEEMVAKKRAAKKKKEERHARWDEEDRPFNELIEGLKETTRRFNEELDERANDEDEEEEDEEGFRV